MANLQHLSVNSTTLGVVREFSPTDLDISAKNLKATANTTYASNVVDVAGFKTFQVALKVAKTGAGAAGAAKLSVTFYAADGTTAVSPTHDVATAISTTTDGLVAVLAWGGDLAAAAINGTVGSNIAALRTAHKLKITLTVVTQSDAATSCTGSVYLTCSA